MLAQYMQSAMQLARFEILPEDGAFDGSSAGFDGGWASAATAEACSDEL